MSLWGYNVALGSGELFKNGLLGILGSDSFGREEDVSVGHSESVD